MYYLSGILILLIVIISYKQWDWLLKIYQEQKQEKINVLCNQVDMQISQVKKLQRKIHIQNDILNRKIHTELKHKENINNEFIVEKKELKKSIDNEFIINLNKHQKKIYKIVVDNLFELIYQKFKISKKKSIKLKNKKEE